MHSINSTKIWKNNSKLTKITDQILSGFYDYSEIRIIRYNVKSTDSLNIFTVKLCFTLMSLIVYLKCFQFNHECQSCNNYINETFKFCVQRSISETLRSRGWYHKNTNNNNEKFLLQLSNRNSSMFLHRYFLNSADIPILLEAVD